MLHAKTHILAIGPHPDDVEVGCGGVLWQSAQAGKKNVILDCSPSQFSTRGNPQQRMDEAQGAAKIMQVAQRCNMGWEDTSIRDCESCRWEIAEKIRELQPEIVMVPYIHDRHPDHEAVPVLVKNAIFYAGLEKKQINGLAPWKPRMLLQYMIWDFFEPDICIGLSEQAFEAKMQAFASYGSQQDTNNHALSYIRGRAQTLGFKIKKPYAEGFKTYGCSLGIDSFDDIYTGFF